MSFAGSTRRPTRSYPHLRIAEIPCPPLRFDASCFPLLLPPWSACPLPRKPKPPTLIGGSYSAPPCEPGSSLVCSLKGRQRIGGLTDAPIPWPYSAERAGGSGRSLILCGDLVRAVQTESVQSICHHWNVGRKVVGEWRKALGVGRMTAGTVARWKELAPRRLTKAARSKGGYATAKVRREGASSR